jgi:endonuclease YncB( thermonuclease family)
MKLSVLVESLTLAALPAFAQSVRVVDGDTLRVDGVTYRLCGIDAPESHQSCADDWPAGRTATEHLRALIRDRHVSCEPVEPAGRQ